MPNVPRVENVDFRLHGTGCHQSVVYHAASNTDCRKSANGSEILSSFQRNDCESTLNCGRANKACSALKRCFPGYRVKVAKTSATLWVAQNADVRLAVESAEKLGS